MTFVKTYKPLPITITRGEGAYVWDSAGKRYLDMYAGHAVCSTGHSHPLVAKAIADQARRLIFYSNVVELDVRVKAAEKLLSFAPKPITDALFVNSGAEAVENSLKMAVLQTKRKQIICFEGGFHGRTLLATNVTGTEKYRRHAPYTIPDVFVCPFGDLASVRSAISDKTAAVILEPIQSMAGCRVAPPEFYQGLRDLTQQHGAYLVYDEVQTGIGRTGTMFFAGRYGVVPDLVCLAKGIASGIPCSAVLCARHVADKVQYGEFGATFGAGPIAMAAMLATLQVVEEALPNVVRVGEYLQKTLNASGIGFLLGVRTPVPAAEVQAKLLERGVIVGTSEDPHVIRLLPPLILTQAQAEDFVKTYREALY